MIREDHYGYPSLNQSVGVYGNAMDDQRVDVFADRWREELIVAEMDLDTEQEKIVEMDR